MKKSMDELHQGELSIPSSVLDDPNRSEIARIWIANDQQHLTIRTSVWNDPAAWGLMLVDLARHIAIAYEQNGKGQREDVLSRIRKAFDVEWEYPTDSPQQKT